MCFLLKQKGVFRQSMRKRERERERERGFIPLHKKNKRTIKDTIKQGTFEKGKYLSLIHI